MDKWNKLKKFISKSPRRIRSDFPDDVNDDRQSAGSRAGTFPVRREQPCGAAARVTTLPRSGSREERVPWKLAPRPKRFRDNRPGAQEEESCQSKSTDPWVDYECRKVREEKRLLQSLQNLPERQPGAESFGGASRLLRRRRRRLSDRWDAEERRIESRADSRRLAKSLDGTETRPQTRECEEKVGGRSRHMSESTASNYRRAFKRRFSAVQSGSARLIASVKGVTSYLYVFGGNELVGGKKYTVERYDINTETWETIGVGLPHFAESYALALHNGYFWVIGGEIDKMATAEVLCCDEAVDIWYEEPRLKYPRSSLGAAVLENKLYVIGGKNGGQILNCMEVYDDDSHSWIDGAPLNRRRHDFGIATHNDRIFVAGGLDGGLSVLKSAEVYSREAGHWTFLKSDLTSRRAFFGLGSVTLRVRFKTLFAVGGGFTANAEYFDQPQWKEVDDSETRFERMYCRENSAIANDWKFFFVIGGLYKDKNPRGISEVRGHFVYRYDTVSNTWTRIQDMIAGRSGAKAIVLPNCKLSAKNDDQNRLENDDDDVLLERTEPDQTESDVSRQDDAPQRELSSLTVQSDENSIDSADAAFKRKTPVLGCFPRARVGISKTTRLKKESGALSKTKDSNGKKQTGAAGGLSLAGRKIQTPAKSRMQAGATPKVATSQKCQSGAKRKVYTPSKTGEIESVAGSSGARRKVNTAKKLLQPCASPTGSHSKDRTPKCDRPVAGSQSGARPKVGSSSKITKINHPGGARRKLPIIPPIDWAGASNLRSDRHKSCIEPIDKPIAGHENSRRVSTPSRAGNSGLRSKANRKRSSPLVTNSPVAFECPPLRQHATGVATGTDSDTKPTSRFCDNAKSASNVIEMSDYLYVFGGNNFSSGEQATIERYSFRRKKWEKVRTLLPHSGKECSVVVFRKRAWIIGGREEPDRALHSVFSFNHEMTGWSTQEPMLCGRMSLGAAVLEDKIYAVGGRNSGEVLGKMEIYDNETGWTKGASLNIKRFGFGIAAHQGKLYVAGGVDNGGVVFDMVEEYSNGLWTQDSYGRFFARTSMRLISTNTELYVVGCGHPEIYDNGTWKQLCCSCISRDRHCLAVAAYEESFYLIGGRLRHDRSKERSRSVNVYDTKSKCWSEIEEMNEIRSDFSAVMLRDVVM